MPVTPSDRPERRRAAARVVILAGDRVLLQGDTDPGVPGSRFWQTPGGGIDPEETPRGAAVREVREETGLAVDPDDLLGPIATRVVAHGYSDRILVQHETFYLLRTAPFEPRPAGLTPREAERRVETRWFPLDELPTPTWPAEIRALASAGGEGRVRLPDVEESTVPISASAPPR